VFIIAATVLALAAITTSSAQATQELVTGVIHSGQMSNYNVARTISVGGTKIFFRKTDGPEIDLRWRKCNDASVHGTYVNFPNPDPTGRFQLGMNFLAGTVFCLTAVDHGSNADDTFTGPLDWNVTS
jgi:hypothetical protein